MFQNDDEHLLIAAKLLGLEVAQLQKWLCHKVRLIIGTNYMMYRKDLDLQGSNFSWVARLLLSFLYQEIKRFDRLDISPTVTCK